MPKHSTLPQRCARLNISVWNSYLWSFKYFLEAPLPPRNPGVVVTAMMFMFWVSKEWTPVRFWAILYGFGMNVLVFSLHGTYQRPALLKRTHWPGGWGQRQACFAFIFFCFRKVSSLWWLILCVTHAGSRCPDIWSNTILGASVKVFLEETDI